MGALVEVKDWQGILALENAAVEAANAMLDTYPDVADFVFNNLGACYQRQGQYEKAIEHLEVCRTIEYSV